MGPPAAWVDVPATTTIFGRPGSVGVGVGAASCLTREDSQKSGTKGC